MTTALNTDAVSMKTKSSMTTEIELATPHGNLKFSHFSYDGQTGILATNLKGDEIPFLRIHSSCIFSESFGTIDCDCASQLDASLKIISETGGVLVYLHQEGRGTGIVNKIRAISLEQKQGLTTVEAFSKLGFESDPRSYDAAISVLSELNIHEVVLATNNPRKIDALRNAGIKVVSRKKLEIETNTYMDKYIEEKKHLLGHHEDS